MGNEKAHEAFAEANAEAAAKHAEADRNFNKDLHKDLLKGVENKAQVLEAVAEIRRGATSICPAEIDLIKEPQVKEAIIASFLKVGKDIAKLAGILEKMLENDLNGDK